MTSLRHVEHCIARQLAYKQLNAFVCSPRPDELRVAAAKADAQHGNSGLHGRLITLKDNIAPPASAAARAAPSTPSPSSTSQQSCLTGASTTAGSKALAGYISPTTSSVASRLVAAGAIVQGKTNMDEFGMGSHTQSGHWGGTTSCLSYARASDGPHSPRSGQAASAELRPRRGPELASHAADGEDGTSDQLSPGGSSGGSAVAVLTGQCFASLGTDTGGSVRLPAAWTGTVGFKGSYGRVSRNGVVDYANSLDTVGVLGRSVADVRAVWTVLDGEDARDGTCLGRTTRGRIAGVVRRADERRGARRDGLRIGVPVEWNVEGLQDCVREAWTRTLDALQERGHVLVPVSLPRTRLALAAYYILAPAEASSNLARYDGVRYGYLHADTCVETSSAPTTSAYAVDGGGTDNPGSVADTTLYTSTRGQAFGIEVRRRILLGAYTLSSEAMDNFFLQAQRVRRLICEDFDRVFALSNVLRPTADRERIPDGQSWQGRQRGLEHVQDRGHEDDYDVHGDPRVDVLITPTAPTLPPRLADVRRTSAVEAYAADVLTVPSSLAGLPAVSVPVPLDPGRGPRTGLDEVPTLVETVGVQVVGQYGDDELVLDVGELVEKLWV